MAEPTTTPLLNPSGKQQLLSIAARIKAHRELVVNPQFQDSLNLALLQYSQMLASGTSESNVAAANMFKLKGAQEFIHQFLYLAESFRPEVAAKPSGNLNHEA